MKAHIGTSGWFYWHWKGLFYPAELPTHHWFKHFLSRFKTVELNAPFYRWPRPSTVKGWERQVRSSRSFKYCVKVNRQITHEQKMAGTERLVRDFYHLVAPLGKKLGCFLFQFPPSFKFSKDNLERIVDQLNPSYRNAVEFRHKSWWNEAVYSAFERRGLIFCSISGPRFPEDLIRTAPDIYVRFHGRDRWYLYKYSTDELQEWADKIIECNPENAWIYFNNDREAHAIRNARKLGRLLKGAAHGTSPRGRTGPLSLRDSCGVSAQ